MKHVHNTFYHVITSNEIFSGHCPTPILNFGFFETNKDPIRINGENRYHPGTILNFTCHPGYTLTGRYSTRYCLIDGTWLDPTLPTCINRNYY